MATFRIGVYEEQSGFVTIEAETKEEAKEKAEEILEEQGIEGFKDFDVQSREVNLI